MINKCSVLADLIVPVIYTHLHTSSHAAMVSSAAPFNELVLILNAQRKS